MIIDHLSNTSAFALVPGWDKIATFLERLSKEHLTAGVYELDGDALYAIVAEEAHRDVVNPLEAHRTYIDVQVALEGTYDIQWRPFAQCKSLLSAYNRDKDFLLMSDSPLVTIPVIPGIAVVLYPTDVHAPQPPTTNVRKVVFKVKVPPSNPS